MKTHFQYLFIFAKIDSTEASCAIGRRCGSITDISIADLTSGSRTSNQRIRCSCPYGRRWKINCDEKPIFGKGKFKIIDCRSMLLCFGFFWSTNKSHNSKLMAFLSQFDLFIVCIFNLFLVLVKNKCIRCFGRISNVNQTFPTCWYLTFIMYIIVTSLVYIRNNNFIILFLNYDFEIELFAMIDWDKEMIN